MKQIKVLPLVFLMSSFALAQDSLFTFSDPNKPYTYISLGLGKKVGAPIDSDKRPTNLAANAQLGYQFNKNWALEADFLRASQGYFFIVDSSYLNAYALSAKSIFPMPKNFNLFSKLGAAYIYTYAGYQASTPNSQVTIEKYDSVDSLGLFLGAGISKDFATHWAGSLEYNAIYVKNSYINGVVGGITLNLSYQFK